MKYVVIDPPEREIDPTQLQCCVYSMISFSTLPGVKPKPKIKAIKAGLTREKSKVSAKAKSAKSAKRKVAA